MTSKKIIAIAIAMAFVPMVGAVGEDTIAHLQQPVQLTELDEGNRWVVGFHELPALRSTFAGFDVLSVNEKLRFFTVEAPGAALHAATLADLNVRYVETDVSDHKLHFTPNDYYYTHASNWGVGVIGAEQAWDRTLGSTSVKDGHLDSGIVADHEDLSGSRFLQGYDFYQGDSTPQDESGCNWHGSHTAGTVAATIDNGLGFAGMAQITVLPVKIFGGSFCWAASTTNMANALQYAGDQGSHVSSNSWGGGSFSTAIHDAITYSTGLGVIFVASSGNDGCNNCIGNPWVQQEANTIIVSATDSSDAGASFNSKGPEVDVSAPGVYIGSAGGPGSSYYIMDGTSMAAPHVSGLVGLVKTLNPSWDRQQVTDKITSTAVDLGPAGHDDEFGHGRIDADAATQGGQVDPQCSDGIDNDGDGLTDFPADPGCTDANDDDETDPPADPQCSDGIDNDGDGLTDYPDDPGCTDANDDDETDPAGGDSVHTHDLDIWKSGRDRYFQVWSYDDAETAESGVDVSIEAVHGSHTATGTAATGGDGSVTFSWRHGKGSYTVCVTDMVKSGFTWDQAAGHASSGNCHTEST